VGLGHRARQALADPLLLGDVVLPEHGRAPFSASTLHLNVTLRGTDAANNSLGEYRATYAFDILALDGEDLRRLPLSMRKT
jgi:ATP-dependent DNA ligase